LEKVPVNPIKGFLEVELKKQALLLLRVELMYNLMESQSSFMQASSLDKSRLTTVYRPMGKGSKSDRVGLGDKLKNNVDESDRSKLLDLINTLNFRD
jgi:hypothetical protein